MLGKSECQVVEFCSFWLAADMASSCRVTVFIVIIRSWELLILLLHFLFYAMEPCYRALQLQCCRLMRAMVWLNKNLASYVLSHHAWLMAICFAQTTKYVHIRHHSLPVLGEYKSTTSLKHSEPLHILIGQSLTTKPGWCSPWNHFFKGILESVLPKIEKMPTFSIIPCQYSVNIRILLLWNIVRLSIY